MSLGLNVKTTTILEPETLKPETKPQSKPKTEDKTDKYIALLEKGLISKEDFLKLVGKDKDYAQSIFG